MSPRSASWEGSRPGSGVGGRRGPAFALLLLVLAGTLGSFVGAPLTGVDAGEPAAPKEGDILPASVEQLEPALTPRCDLAVPAGGEHVRFLYRAFPRRRFTGGRWIADPEVRAVHLCFTEMDARGAVRPIPAGLLAVAGSPLPPVDPALRPGVGGRVPAPGGNPVAVEWTPSWSEWEGGTLVTFALAWSPDHPLLDDPEPPPPAGSPEWRDPRLMPVTGVTFGLRARRRAGAPDDVPDVYTASFAFTRTGGPPDYPALAAPTGASSPPPRRPAFDLGHDIGGPNTPHWLARVERLAPPGRDVAFQVPPVVAPIEPRLVEATKDPLVLVPGGVPVVLRVPRVYAGSGYRVHLSQTRESPRASEDGHGLAFDPGGLPGVPAAWGITVAPREGVFFPTQAFETVNLSRAPSSAPSVPGEVWLVVEHLNAPNQRMPLDPRRISTSPPLRVFLGVSATDWDGDGASNAVDGEPLDATKR